MKFLGIDYGTKRIGIAISDEEGFIAFPKGILENTKENVEKLLALIAEESIQAIVIGESVASNGAPNVVLDQIQKFKAALTLKTELPIFFEREDFSSVEAHRYQTAKGARDDSAAAIILQRFLDKKKK